jgi:hypothetical protein
VRPATARVRSGTPTEPTKREAVEVRLHAEFPDPEFLVAMSPD